MRRTEGAAPAWRTLPVAAVAILYVDGVQRLVRQNLLAFGGAGTGLAISDALSLRELLAGVALLLLAGLLLAMVYHRRFRYRVDGDSIRVRRGLLEQKELEVRFERVQNVGFSQPFYLRPLALRRVTLETPGAAETEVELPGIAEDEARALRDRVNGARRAAAGATPGVDDPARPGDATGQDAHVFFRAGPRDLFRHGLASSQTWLLFAFLGGPAASWVETRVERTLAWMSEAGLLASDEFASAPWIAAAVVFVMLVAFAVSLLMLSGLAALVRYHGFTLTGDDERLRAAFGLLDAREHTLRRTRLHGIECVQSAVARLLGCWYVVGHQTGAAAGPETPEQADRRFLIPGVASARLPAVLAALRGPDRTPGTLHGVDRRLRTIAWQRLCAPLLVLAAVLAALLPPAVRWPAVLLAVLALFLAAVAHLRWKRWGWLRVAGHLVIRRGLVGQRLLAFDLDRCQQVRITTSPYQRRHGLATLHLRLPHGEQELPYLPAATAAELANRALLAAERAGTHAL